MGIGSYLEDQQETGSSCRRLHPYHLRRSSRILLVVGNGDCKQQQQQLFKNLGSQIIFGFHDKLYVETAI